MDNLLCKSSSIRPKVWKNSVQTWIKSVQFERKKHEKALTSVEKGGNACQGL